MNQYSFSCSESIILTLCKEIEYIKIRSKNINTSLKTCQNKILYKRLKLELRKLNISRLKILTISESMFNKNSNDLSYEFFLEVSKRSKSFQQI